MTEPLCECVESAEVEAPAEAPMVAYEGGPNGRLIPVRGGVSWDRLAQHR